MKILLKIGNGPTRSLNRVVGLIIGIIIAAAVICVTDWAIDAEIRHNDLTVENFLKNTKFSTVNTPHSIMNEE